MKKTNTIILAIIGLSFLIGVYFYPQMPEKMMSHWDEYGQVNGYMTKFWGLFFMPLITLGLFLLFLVIPKIDPLKENIAKFRKYFDNFIILIIGFLFYIYLLTIFWNLNWQFSINLLLMPAFALLFYYCGVLIENAKRNWFIGIRTPWTLSSDSVWEKTHKLGSKLFKLAAVIILIGLFFEDFLFYFVLIPILLFTAYITVYSFLEYQKETKKN